MNISHVSNGYSNYSTASENAVRGIYSQQDRLQSSIEKVVHNQQNSASTTDRDQRLVEQQDIANSLKANARALEAANHQLGVLIDIEA